ncbi:DMT family transporter [Caldimonas brevitalea]|uniref:Permease of the drug/metabolite transporter n=1 Tax=Caldimonas brevitalea TaxID=413882 RepID=A0A0G3BIU8_9BURK|nr:SMR family transporter [Caldimonas brevitalea]AKJ27923.1 permease of the drug/metabolite transporter [Caldimonas brevitalea]
MTARLLLLILTSVGMSSLAQIMLKFGMSKPGMQGPFDGAGPVALAFATNPFVVGGLALYGLGAMVWLAVLARIDVSVAYPFVGLGFILTMALGYWLFNEPLSTARVLGTLLIVSGVVLVARSA